MKFGFIILILMLLFAAADILFYKEIKQTPTIVISRLDGIIPARFVAPLNPVKVEQEVLINWLEKEIPQKKKIIPILNELKGWRNREIYYYVKSHDWTTDIYK